MSAKVTVYSADWCAFCRAAKDYLDKEGVPYVEKNVEKNAEFGKESIEISGQTGIPVIDVDGTIIVGFDRARLDTALKDKKLK